MKKTIERDITNDIKLVRDFINKEFSKNPDTCTLDIIQSISCIMLELEDFLEGVIKIKSDLHGQRAIVERAKLKPELISYSSGVVDFLTRALIHLRVEEE